MSKNQKNHTTPNRVSFWDSVNPSHPVTPFPPRVQISDGEREVTKPMSIEDLLNLNKGSILEEICNLVSAVEELEQFMINCGNSSDFQEKVEAIYARISKVSENVSHI